jgi:2-oxoisovalerate dehydrogenase E1 component beta subunit
MATVTMAAAINLALRHDLEHDPKVILMGEDIGRLGGVFRVTEGLQKDFGEERVMDTPLAESGIVGTAIGLALYGYRPIVEIQFDGFVFPAFDQIITQLARMRYRSMGSLSAPVVIRIPFGGGIGSVEHHSESPEAYFAHTPGLRVVAASSPQDAYWLLRDAVASDDPVIFFEPKRRYWQSGELETDRTSADVPDMWSARVVRAGDHCTVLTYGAMVATCLRAAELGLEHGISLEIVDLRSLSPLDLATIRQSVSHTRRAVVVHEAPRSLGVAAEVSARITESMFYDLEAPVQRVTGFDIPYPPSRVEEDYLPDAQRVLQAASRTFEY